VSKPRHFLLLQGTCSPFFARLADQLQSEGHRVSKLNFTGGDVAYWGMRPSWRFSGTPTQLPDFLCNRTRNIHISDLVLFGDCRPVHRKAIEWAKNGGIRIHVFEEGYLRPHWVTLERDGVNARSGLPRDPTWFRSVGARLPDAGAGLPFPAPFRIRAWHDVIYHVASSVNPLLFRGYTTHAPVSAPVEYLGYLRRFALLARIEQRERARVAQLAANTNAYFVLPLQLNGDSQIREQSRFRHMRTVIETVMESFALHAPQHSRLVIKNHPLDFGLTDYARLIRDNARRFALTGRTDYLEAGSIDTLISHAQGVVTVNSTVGMLALGAGRPTIALGQSIYNLQGLTFQGSLDEFWRCATPPEVELFRCFRNAVIHGTQVNGGLYSRQGIDMTVRNSIGALTASRSPLEELHDG
jgi:capsular polysaccharide export protein